MSLFSWLANLLEPQTPAPPRRRRFALGHRGQHLHVGDRVRYADRETLSGTMEITALNEKTNMITLLYTDGVSDRYPAKGFVRVKG